MRNDLSLIISLNREYHRLRKVQDNQHNAYNKPKIVVVVSLIVKYTAIELWLRKLVSHIKGSRVVDAWEQGVESFFSHLKFCLETVVE